MTEHVSPASVVSYDGQVGVVIVVTVWVMPHCDQLRLLVLTVQFVLVTAVQAAPPFPVLSKTGAAV